MPRALPHQPTPVPSEVADQIRLTNHPANARTFVIMGLIGLPMPDVVPPISLSIVYEPVERGWVQARIEGIPEVITAGRSKDEARELVLDALREYLASIRGNGEADRERVDLTIAGAD
jgi:predicted RNase H-like HicB family nuclease